MDEKCSCYVPDSMPQDHTGIGALDSVDCLDRGAMARRNRTIDMPAPYLRRIWLEPSRIADRAAYPFFLPFLHDDFELSLDRPITIIVGENGTGKSTLLEGIAVLAGYDEAGGGKGYRPVAYSMPIGAMGGRLYNAT